MSNVSNEMWILLICFVCAGRLMWTGSSEISTRTVITRSKRHKYSRDIREYTLTHGIIPYLGWIKLAWSVPILILGFQVLLKLHPTLIETVMPRLKLLLKTTDQNILTGLFFVSIAIFFTSDMLAMMFGESRLISRGSWGRRNWDGF